MKRIVLIATILALAACDVPKTAQPDARKKMYEGEVALFAVAPDGTKLWGAYVNGRDVYFSSTGASWVENCGKNCRRDVQVPNTP